MTSFTGKNSNADGLDRLLTLDKVAAIFDVCEKTIRRWVADGKLPQLTRAGRRSALWYSEVQRRIDAMKRGEK